MSELVFGPGEAAALGRAVLSLDRGARIAFLNASRPRLIDYLKMKLDAEDWHGVQDAASDLRDVDSELDGLRY